jgi:hypothetical protein
VNQQHLYRVCDVHKLGFLSSKVWFHNEFVTCRVKFHREFVICTRVKIQRVFQSDFVKICRVKSQSEVERNLQGY